MLREDQLVLRLIQFVSLYRICNGPLQRTKIYAYNLLHV